MAPKVVFSFTSGGVDKEKQLAAKELRSAAPEGAILGGGAPAAAGSKAGPARVVSRAEAEATSCSPLGCPTVRGPRRKWIGVRWALEIAPCPPPSPKLEKKPEGAAPSAGGDDDHHPVSMEAGEARRHRAAIRGATSNL